MLAILAAAAFAAPLPPAAVTAPSCVGCEADVATIEGRLSKDDWAKLRKGQIITLKEDDVRGEDSISGRVFAYGVIPAPPTKVWETLADFDSWPNYLPRLETVRVDKVEGENLWLYHMLKIMFVSIEYTVIYTFEPEIGRASWVLDKEAKHDIGDTSGFWEFVPVNQGRFTLATYHANVNTGMPVPRFVENFLTKESLPQIIEGLRGEVQRRTGPTKAK